MRSDLIDLTLFVCRDEPSDKAILVAEDDDKDAKKVWLARSQIEIEYEKGRSDVAVVTLPEWLALEKGLI
ncbi:MAG: hypothetical protein P4L76_18000 [Beijerinckiaceae bacterium]|nr:hypothetical protein [Beijerinckiaceae bacterium]